MTVLEQVVLGIVIIVCSPLLAFVLIEGMITLREDYVLRMNRVPQEPRVNAEVITGRQIKRLVGKMRREGHSERAIVDAIVEKTRPFKRLPGSREDSL